VLALLQFDATSVHLVERLLSDGRLPSLAGLRDRGQYFRLETPATHWATGTYHTLYSGLDMGEHGLYYPFQWSAAEQRVRYISSFDRPETVWERLTRADRRSLVVDPYECQPTLAVDGVYLSGWQFKNRLANPRFSLPRGTYRELARRFGRSEAVEEVFGSPSVAEWLRMRRHLVAAPGRVADAVRYLLGRERFDLVWATFAASHLGGHQFWEVAEALDGGLEGDSVRPLKTALTDIYKAVDAAIGDIIAALPSDADVIVFSPTGMSVNTGRADWLAGMLEAVLSDGRSDSARGRPTRGSPVWRVRALVPTRLRARVARALPDRLVLRLTSRLEAPALDWSRTRAFALPSDFHGYVRLNVRGREREGIVEPREMGALVDEITEGLMTFRDPDGSRSVGSVDRVSELVEADTRIDQLPDLVVTWTDQPSTRVTEVSSPRHGDVPRRAVTGRSGSHTGDAWAVVATGASRVRLPARAPRVVDIPATACALLGADTQGVAGESLLETPVVRTGLRGG
jgi:predicted AlkP superfamily phosphohydrolase/phosphomutase